MAPEGMHEDLKEALRQLRRSLPKGSLLTYQVHEDGVHLDLFRLPTRARGGLGTDVLAQFLTHTDAAGLPVWLTADPTDDAGDPSTFDLARWYTRFGFVGHRAHDNGVDFIREAQAPQPAEALAAQARAAKAQDLTTTQLFEVWWPWGHRAAHRMAGAGEAALAAWGRMRRGEVVGEPAPMAGVAPRRPRTP